MPPRKTLLLFFLLLLMELLPGFVLLVGTSLLEATAWGYGLFWLLVLAATAGAIAGPAVARSVVRPRRQRTALVALGAVVATALAGLSANGPVTFLASLLFLAVAFWRGLACTAEPPDHDEVQRRFGYGFAILFFGILWVIARGIIDRREIWQMLAAAGIAFVLVSMIALVTARVASERNPGAGRAIALAVTVQLGALALLSLAALQIFAFDLAGSLGHSLQPAFDALGRSLSGIVGLIADPVDRFVQLIRPHARPRSQITVPSQQSSAFYGKRPKYHPPFRTPLVNIISVMILGAIIAGIGYAVWRAIPLARTRSVSAAPYKEERRSLLSVSALWRAMLRAFLALWQRSRRVASDTITATGRRAWGPSYPADPVRRTYSQILRRAKSLGLVRARTDTPDEFNRRLAGRWPGGSADFALATAMYVRRRYGDVLPAAEDLASLHGGWQRLRHEMRGPARGSAGIALGRAALASMMTSPEHERPQRPFPRDARPARRAEGDKSVWRPTGPALVIISLALPVLVIVGFLVILAIASGRLG